MQRYTKLEISVGLFVVIGALSLAYLSLTLGGLRLGAGDRYPLTARFSSVGSLKNGDPVKVAGVSVGEVTKIRLVDFNAEAELSVTRELKLPADTIASIQSAGLLGDSYVSLSPGASEQDLPPGGSINRTESAVNLMGLISKYAFGAGPEADDSAPERRSNDGGSGNVQAPKANAQNPFSDPLE
jgi:phospholipid/cholesterol/gamma-HCH transport system substrate-binding protein